MTATAENPTTLVAPQDELADLFARYSKAWDRRDPDGIAAFHSPEGVFHLHAGAEPVRGRAAIRDAFAELLAQWPDLEFAETAFRTGLGFWVFEWSMEATSREGVRVSADAVDVVLIEDGMLTVKHTYIDAVTILSQMEEAA
jgi:ketosteroid isomerase-like protein